MKTCKQQAGRQVRVAETCGPFPFFLHHHHLGDLWSECQRWKYTNRYSLIIYSQVYIPKTVTFHYFQLCLKTIPSEVDPSLLWSRWYPSTKQHSQHGIPNSSNDHTNKSKQLLEGQGQSADWSFSLFFTLCTTLLAQKGCFSHSVGTLLRQAGVLMWRRLDLRQTRLCFTSAARIENLIEIHSAPVDVQVTSHNSMQQIICLGCGYWTQKHIPSS